MLGTQNKVEAAPAPNQERFSPNLTEVDHAYGSLSHGNVSATFNRQTLDIQHMAALYEDIALPDAFLKDYYSQVVWAVCLAYFFQQIYIHIL